MLAALASGKSYDEAVRSMKISGFFLHSYSSFLFNLAASNAMRSGSGNFTLEKIGSSTVLDSANEDAYSEILKSEGMSLSAFSEALFKVDGHPRSAFFFPENFRYRFEGGDIILEFSLGKGEYASLMLEFLVDSEIRKLC